MTTRRICLIAIAGAVGLGLGNATATATPGEGDVVRTDLAKGETAAPISIVTEAGQPTTLLVQSLVLKPGAHSGWHTHPGPEYSVITEGAVVLRTAQQCSGTSYAHGQVVFIPAGVPHRVDNQGAVDASVVVNYTLPADAPVRIDAPDVCQK
jgi:quercetin dioxygenase-like cupin family protein